MACSPLSRGLLRLIEMCGWPVSRVLSTPDRDPGLDDHSSARTVTSGVKLPTRASGLKVPAAVPPILRSGTSPREAPIRHCSGWGLPYRPGCPVRGGLLPHRFTIALGNVAGGPATPRQSFLCGAFPRVAPAGHYPAPCLHGARTFLVCYHPRSSSHPHVCRIRLRAAGRQRQTDPPNPPSCPHRRRPSAPWPMAETAVETPQAQDHPLRPDSQTGAHLG